VSSPRTYGASAEAERRSLEETWNDPRGSGSFKQLWAQEIRVDRS
jgi:hypothetical protein